VLLNDRVPFVVLRNIILLSILGQTTNIKRDADVALHACYPAFLPSDYYLRVFSAATDLLTAQTPGEPFQVNLGQHSSLHTVVSSEDMTYLAAIMKSTYSVADVNAELHRVMYAYSPRSLHAF
jgi:hypothetical protein